MSTGTPLHKRQTPNGTGTVERLVCVFNVYLRTFGPEQTRRGRRDF